MNMQTYKDGVNQPRLSFGLNAAEWAAFVFHREDVKKALRELKVAGGDGSQGEPEQCVLQYRGLAVKDGGVTPGSRWCYAEEQAQQDGIVLITGGGYLRMQKRRAVRPHITAVRAATDAALLLRAMKREDETSMTVVCIRCEEDQTKQMAHSCCQDVSEGLYARARDGVTTF